MPISINRPKIKQFLQKKNSYLYYNKSKQIKKAV